jgi:radical SAM protein with 4Fe4S-binding SPASM domain
MDREDRRFKDMIHEDKSIMLHLTVTGRCYAQCEGCINSAITVGSLQPRNSIITFQETEPERDSAIILGLAARHPGQIITVCFYGGEPFLAADKMQKVWKILNESSGNNEFRYTVYTNGELLISALKRYPEFMQDMWLYSVSIDGDEEQHNRVRKGTDLAIIINNLKELRTNHGGQVLHWSTLREKQSLWNCFEEFMSLYREGLVNHFFWHWAETLEPYDDFQSYTQTYDQELQKIMDVYAKRLSAGELLPVCHVNELILYLLTGKERGHTACGVELAKNYDVVSGKVFPCADLPSSHQIGKLDVEGKLNLKEDDLSSLVEYKEWLGCYACGVHPYCGGRCPVQAVAGSRERTFQYCQLMRLHVGIIQERIDDIAAALKKNNISLQDIYARSAFLARYTDVVP